MLNGISIRPAVWTQFTWFLLLSLFFCNCWYVLFLNKNKTTTTSVSVSQMWQLTWCCSGVLWRLHCRQHRCQSTATSDPRRVECVRPLSIKAAINLGDAALTVWHGSVGVPHLQGHQVLRLLQVTERHRYWRYIRLMQSVSSSSSSSSNIFISIPPWVVTSEAVD